MSVKQAFRQVDVRSMGRVGELEKNGSDALRAVLETALDPFILLEPVIGPNGDVTDFVIESANGAACDVPRRHGAALDGLRLLDEFPQLEHTRFFAQCLRVATTGEPFTLDRGAWRVNGRRRVFTARATKVGDRVAVVWRDATRTEEAYERVELQARLLDLVDAGVIATDEQFRIEYWSKGAEVLYGWRQDEVLGKTTFEVLMPDAAPGVLDEIRESMRDGDRSGRPFELVRKDGTSLNVLANTAPLVEDGEVVGFLGVSVDITEQHAVEQSLRQTRDFLAAITDSMGEGMYALDARGHVMFMNPAAERLLDWRMHELPDAPMHDITHYEHADGTPHPSDECPLRAASMAGDTVRVHRDVFIRRDGTHLPVAYVAAPVRSDDQRVGCVVVFRDISDQISEEARIERELNKLAWVGRIQDALENDRFVLHAQPIRDLRTKEITQHELLLRMVTPEGEIVLPTVFLPTAEEFGLVQRIDRWVVAEAIQLARTGIPVEFNLSARSLGDAEILTLLREAAATHPEVMDRLVCEVTETALMRVPEEGEEFVRALRDLGCRVALDDFGTGYGGFAYLKRLPVSYLKIDTQFVRDAVHEPTNQHVIRAVVSLASAFELETVAEGAESEESLRLLAELGVDHAQGRAISAPVPVDWLTRWDI